MFPQHSVIMGMGLSLYVKYMIQCMSDYQCNPKQRYTLLLKPMGLEGHCLIPCLYHQDQ